MNTKNTKIDEGHRTNKISLAGGKKLKRYNAFCYQDDNGGFYSYGKYGETTGEISIISKRYASRANAEHDLTCHVRDAHGLIPICWHTGTKDDVKKAKEGCGEKLKETDIPPKKKFVQEYVIRIEGEPNMAPLGWGDVSHEMRHLNSLHALGFIADEVERYFQTSLENRTVTIRPKN